MLCTIALLVSLVTSAHALTEDRYVEPVAYATDTQKVILRNWVIPDYGDCQQNNAATPEHVASVELLPAVRQPVRIGRAERCSIG